MVDWTHVSPKKRDEMYNKDRKVPIGKSKGRERKERRKGVEKK